VATLFGGSYPGELQVLSGSEQVASAAAELFVNVAAQSISARGRFRGALSGGCTPREVYELLATAPITSRPEWNYVELFWGDERYVSPNDRDSNYRTTAEALLRHIQIPRGNIHRVPTEISPPQDCAKAYEKDLRQSFGESVTVPEFDLIYLGLGTIGHTASLFPHLRGPNRTTSTSPTPTPTRGTWSRLYRRRSLFHLNRSQRSAICPTTYSCSRRAGSASPWETRVRRCNTGRGS